jgi:hypothetical protein
MKDIPLIVVLNMDIEYECSQIASVFTSLNKRLNTLSVPLSTSQHHARLARLPNTTSPPEHASKHTFAGLHQDDSELY